jgi:uncharacterized membrane protein YbaN (DUF454 family)
MHARYLWLLLGLAATGCGIIGAVLPLLPTTPFLLVAAYAFARSSPRLHAWLLDHPQFGPLISNWQAHGAIASSVKITAIIVMLGALGLSWLMGFALWIVGVQAGVLSVVALFILTRPDSPAR